MRHHLHYKCLLDPGLPRAGYASCGLSVANQTFWKNKNAVIIWWGCKGHWNFGLHRMEVISAQDARLNFKWYWRKYMWDDWLTKIEEKMKHTKKDTDQISSRLCNPEGSRVLPLEIRNASLTLRMASLFEVMSSRGTSSMLSIEWARRVTWSETAIGW